MIQIDMPMPRCCDECFALDDYGDYPFCLISRDQRGYTFNTRNGRMPTCPLKEQDEKIKDEKIKKLHLLLNAKLSAQPLIQKLAERLQRIADIAGDYDNYPTRNGLEWVCIEIQEIAMHGLQEVKDEDTEDAWQESGQEV